MKPDTTKKNNVKSHDGGALVPPSVIESANRKKISSTIPPVIPENSEEKHRQIQIPEVKPSSNRPSVAATKITNKNFQPSSRPSVASKKADPSRPSVASKKADTLRPSVSQEKPQAEPSGTSLEEGESLQSSAPSEKIDSTRPSASSKSPVSFEKRKEEPLANDGVDDGAVSVDSSGSEQEASDDSKSRAVRKAAKKSFNPADHARTGIIVLSVLAVTLIVLAILFSWNRWWRFDDVADIQGEWQIAGSDVPITIDATSIHLADDVSYEYTLDTKSKTIHYQFGPMEGNGSYWMNADRNTLVLVDGEFTFWQTLKNDIKRTNNDVYSSITFTPLVIDPCENMSLFNRVGQISATEPDSDPSLGEESVALDEETGAVLEEPQTGAEDEGAQTSQEPDRVPDEKIEIASPSEPLTIGGNAVAPPAGTN